MRSLRVVLPACLLTLSSACGGDSTAGTSFTSLGGTSSGGDTNSTSSSEGTTTDATNVSASADGSTSLPDPDTSSTNPDPDTSSGSSGDTGIDACDQVDVPDINGLDENGDGIDGVVCRAVFVNAAIGSDLNGGLATDDPVATIGRAIEIAQTYDPPRMVLVAAGTYVETINVNSGVSLYGGYNPDDWSRDINANATAITATENRAIIAQNLDLAVEIDGFTINALSYTDESQTSYGVWVRDTPEGLFTLDYCTIAAGNGGDGADGADGDPGADGEGGDSAMGGSPGAGGGSLCGATGGNGGSGLACPSTDGTDGSAGGDPTTVGQGQTAGASQCGSDCDDEGTNAAAGLPGEPGVNGDGGSTAADNEGAFGGDGIWAPPAGSDSTRGDHGAGGGGGGAGGFDVDSGVFCLFDSGNGTGGGGGGGGAGGCGGAAGGVGFAGGGSFAIVAVNSSITVTNTELLMADGGDGGDGGNGGDGGAPGGPGNGVNGIDDGGEPGDGANGGSGGGGGGGGGGAGGCGGASIGIATVGDAAAALNNVSFNGGVGGQPGVGGVGGLRANGLGQLAPDGADGCAGFRADQHAY